MLARKEAALGAIRNALNKDRIYARVPQSQKQHPGDDDYQQTDEDGCVKDHRFLPELILWSARYSLKPDMQRYANRR